MAARIPCGENQIPISEPTAANSSRAINLFLRIKLIPWRQIWESMFDSPIRGYAESTEVLINSLVEEALVDDQGAWSHTQEKAGK